MRTWISRRLRPLLAASAVLGLAWAAWSQREAIASFDWSIDHGLLALAIGLFAVAPLLQGLTFALGLRRIGAGGSPGALARLWARSFLLRYEPSGVVGFAYRVTARERVGASTAQVMTVTGYEQLAVVVAGAAAAMAGFLGAGAHPPVVAIVLFVAALIAAVAARPAFVGGWVHDRLRARGIETAGPLRGRTLALMVALDGAGWVATGLGAWALARALGATAGLDAFLLLGAFALSWLLGVLVPLAPGGLGLREGSLILSLGAAVGAGPATALALALRLVSFARELVAIGVAELAALAFAFAQRASTAPVAAPAPTPAALPAADRSGTIVVVPTYCEADALPRFVERFAATGLELLVVDDASPDGTGELADALAAERPWMHVLHRAGKDGLGMAYRAGFGWCLERGYRVIGQMDSDLSHPPEKLAEMLAVLDAREADLVLGNRYMPGGGTAGWSTARRVLSRVGCTGSKLVLGLPFDDLSGGFKLWRASMLAELDFDSMLSTGYAFQVETTQLAYLMGKRIEEVPFVFSERIAGESKMTLAVSLEGIRVTFALRRRARGRRGGVLVT
ncbi:MAG TPA: glycosyltransferase [Solirubrobacteraceae bacterium]|nr:glycosyltransferase [Solirubrobacteraceae bacterium]